MQKKIYEVELAGHPVRFAFQYPETKRFFRRYLKRSSAAEYDILSSPERIEAARLLLPAGSSDGYVEYRTLIELTALELLRYRCCILHAVSFLWRGYAWLLAAPSGVGKTTQFLNWQAMYPGEISMICGDMPVLAVRDNGSIWVYPSSWNGKENIGSMDLSAPLGGIVLLEQGSSNSIAPVTPKDAITPLFQQFLLRPRTENEILALTGLMDQMLRGVPIWKLTNLGDHASTEMLRAALSRHAEKNVRGTYGTI